MDRSDDNTLFAELRELRPTPRPAFAAELDRRAAAGFPRGERASMAQAPFAKLADRRRRMTARRRLVPALGFALTILVVATVAVATSHSGSGSSSVATSLKKNDVLSEEVLIPAESEASAGVERDGAAGAAAGKVHGEKSSAGAEEEGIPQYEVNKAEAEAKAYAKKVPELNSFDASLNGRAIERSAYVVLGTKPDEVSGAAAKVYAAVHAAHGVVLHSSVQSGSAGATGASFALLLPSRKLDDALATFSSIAEVRQRHDATDDITAPTVSAAEELADSNATIDGLLKELADTETEAERESVEARLREEHHRHAAIRASLDHLRKRASMSEVNVRIVTGKGAGATPPAKGGGWGIGDALHDAGHVLTIAAGVLLIGLAVLAPFALFALVFWAGNRFRVRRLRERTLN